MKRVLFVEAQMKLYRRPFYEQLYAVLKREGIQLKVIYSAADATEDEKHDNCDLPEEFGLKVKGRWLVPARLLWQPALRQAVESDLVVVDHANRFILNHLLLPASLLGLKKVAFWGLGENLQAERSEFSEWYKRRTLNCVDWWFAYTEGTARYLETHGVPRNKITAVQNSVDTREIQTSAATLTARRKLELRANLGIAQDAPVGIFVGMLHRVKSVPLLLEAAARIRRAIPGFQLIVAGGGPDEEDVRRKACGDTWVHILGPQFGRRKAELLAISDVFLLPGRAGLAVLDGLAAGLPVIATRLPFHGPEIEYLEEGKNGMLTEPNPAAYADAVIRVLADAGELELLSRGATESARKYSIEAMAENFRDGIQRCLARPRRQDVLGKWRSQQPA